MLSTHQSVGYRIPVEMLAGLVDRYDHLIGVNCSHPDHGYLVHLIDAVGAGSTVHVGRTHPGPDGAVARRAGVPLLRGQPRAPAVRIGGGALRAAATCPRVFESFGTVVRLFDLLYGHGGIRATKAVLTRLGLPGGTVRKPQLTIPADVVTEIVSVLDVLGLAAIEGW